MTNLRELMTTNGGMFTIDDAFETECDDEAVRTYGSTTESTPLKPKRNVLSENSIVVKVDDIFKDSNRGLDRLKIPEDAISKDSDSLIHDVYYSTDKYDTSNSWWTHPKVKENWKIVLAAFVLLIIGLGLLVTGTVIEIIPNTGIKGFVFLIAGFICFIPGAYHVVYIYCAVKGRRGYDFYNLPLFN